MSIVKLKVDEKNGEPVRRALQCKENILKGDCIKVPFEKEAGKGAKAEAEEVK